MEKPTPGRRRNDFNRDCPHCGSSHVMGYGGVLTRYKCLDCKAVYDINPNACRLCGEWIADDAEYCEWHRRYGHDDGKDDLFVEDGVCTICQKRRTYKFFEYCRECLETWHPDFREDYVDINWDEEDEEDGYLPSEL